MKRLMVILLAAAAILALAGPRAMACNCNKKGGDGGKMSAAPEKTDALAASLLKPYLAIRTSLAADKLDGVAANVSSIKETLKKGVSDAKQTKKPPHYTGALDALMKSAGGLAGNAKNLAGAREAFGGLSDALVQYVRANVSSADAAKYQLFYCEMAKHNWLQASGEKKGNPYYGKSMADCGDKKAIFAACGKGSCDGAGCSGASSCGEPNPHGKHKH